MATALPPARTTPWSGLPRSPPAPRSAPQHRGQDGADVEVEQAEVNAKIPL